MSNVSIIQLPASPLLVEEGIRVVLQNNQDTDGDHASLALQVGGAATDYANGETFTLTAAGVDLEFTFYDTPYLDDGLSIVSGQAGDTLDDVRDKIMDAFQSNLNLLKDYNINADPYGVVSLTAKKSGSAFDIALTNSTIPSLSVDELIHGGDASIAPDYAFYLAVVDFADGENGEPIGEDFLLPKFIGNYYQAESDLQDYLKNKLTVDFTFPFTGTIARPLDKAVLQYFLRYGAYKYGKFYQIFNTFDSPLLVLPGGLNRMDSDFLASENTHYFGYYNNNRRFLTWAPTTKETFPDVSERLFFFNAFGTLDIQISMQYSDNSEQTKTITSALTETYKIYEIAAGVSEIFSETERNNLISYTIWLADAAGQVSEKRTFNVNTGTYEHVRTLIFQNSFGMYDMLHLTGEQSLSDNVKRTLFDRFRSGEYRKQIALVENQVKYTISSGWLYGKETRLWLEDILLSKDMFLVMGDFLLPITHTTGKVLRSRDGEDLYSLSLTFEPDYNNRRYSSIIGEGAVYVKDENWEVFTDENGQTYVY